MLKTDYFRNTNYDKSAISDMFIHEIELNYIFLDL